MKGLSSFVLFLICFTFYTQNLIDIVNTNIKLSFGRTQDVYYSFDTGDEIVFNFQMKKGKHFKSIAIASSSNVIFKEFNGISVIQ
tara:strand:- start:768 stop:1022 length:255 start_codon:yes stop_codon:yes gene_type:complete